MAIAGTSGTLGWTSTGISIPPLGLSGLQSPSVGRNTEVLSHFHKSNPEQSRHSLGSSISR